MTESLNRPLMVLIALIQGLLLFWLKEALIGQGWPHGVRVAETLLWSVSLSVPILILLSLNSDNHRRVFAGAMAFFVVVALISSYVGWQLEPNEKVRGDGLLWVFGLTLAVLLFKVVMYLQIWANGEQFTYSQLFLYSWRNTILVALCLLFVLVFGAILFLWAALFDVVGIELFSEIFEESWFLFPVLALANGLAFTIFRKLVGILDTMSRVLRALCQFLLPVLAFISVLFLICLPFVGFSALWDTGRGTALVLWLQALTLFFFNATFQGEKDGSPYWKPVQYLVSLGLLVLPAYSLVAIYGLWLRIDQYGLTVARCWAIVVVGLLALFALAYTVNLIVNRTNAANKFGWINVRMGLVVLALMVLVNTPVLDFRKLTVSSQLALVNSGEISIDDLDFYYFSRELGRPGYLALEELKIGADEALLDRINNARNWYGYRGKRLSEAEVREQMTVYPPDLVVPELLLNKFVHRFSNEGIPGEVFIINQDLNSDGEGDWVVIRQFSYNYMSAELWQQNESGWIQKPMALSDYGFQGLAEQIKDGAISLETSEWKVLKIGDLSIRVSE